MTYQTQNTRKNSQLFEINIVNFRTLNTILEKYNFGIERDQEDRRHNRAKQDCDQVTENTDLFVIRQGHSHPPRPGHPPLDPPWPARHTLRAESAPVPPDPAASRPP